MAAKAVSCTGEPSNSSTSTFFRAPDSPSRLIVCWTCTARAWAPSARAAGSPENERMERRLDVAYRTGLPPRTTTRLPARDAKPDRTARAHRPVRPAPHLLPTPRRRLPQPLRPHRRRLPQRKARKSRFRKDSPDRRRQALRYRYGFAHTKKLARRRQMHSGTPAHVRSAAHRRQRRRFAAHRPSRGRRTAQGRDPRRTYRVKDRPHPPSIAVRP